MFEKLDILISLALIYLILSMTHKYIMSLVKRAIKLKVRAIKGELDKFSDSEPFKLLLGFLEKKDKRLLSLRALFKDESDDNIVGANVKHLKAIVDEFSMSNEFVVPGGTGDTPAGDADRLRADAIAAMKEKVEASYSSVLTQVQTAYMDKIRKYSILFAIIFALLINADFFTIYKSLSHKSAVTQGLAKEAGELTDKLAKLNKAIDESEITEMDKEDSDKIKNDMEAMTDRLMTADIGIGWPASCDKWTKLSIFNKILGILISGLLISFGAPFWHDLLKTFLNIRKKTAILRR
jgi:hypothetical protein